MSAKQLLVGKVRSGLVQLPFTEVAPSSSHLLLFVFLVVSRRACLLLLSLLNQKKEKKRKKAVMPASEASEEFDEDVRGCYKHLGHV